MTEKKTSIRFDPSPTADDVGRAIASAAALTGEDPVACLSRVKGLVCRIYAMQALLRCFPGLERQRAAVLVGCPGNPSYFEHNAHKIVRKSPRWKPEIYQAVVDAVLPHIAAPVALPVIEAPIVPPAPKRAPAPRQKLEPKAPAAKPVVPRAPAPPARPMTRAPVLFQRFGCDDRQVVGAQTSKRELADLLAEAAANTAKLQRGE